MEPVETETGIQKDNLNGVEKYEVDGVPIEVKWHKVLPMPTSGEFPEDKATVFLPGWSMSGEARSVAELNQSLADESNSPTFAINTRAEQVVPSSLIYEAEAIRQFLEDRGLKEITLVGHSQGGIKAVNLATLLQKRNPNIKVRGVILLDSVGLYQQEEEELVKGFTKDALINTPNASIDAHLADINKKQKSPSIGKTFQAGIDIMFGILNEIKTSGLNYPNRLKNEVREMAAANPRLAELNVPVILIQGREDPISSPEKILPENLIQIQAHREQFLKENFFPESPYVRLIIAEKAGLHGLALFRPVAKAALYMLKRWERQQAPAA